MNEIKDKIYFLKDKSECCACGACVNICSKNAITMKEDEYGFYYPTVNLKLCVNCGLCRSVCPYKNVRGINHPIESYAASRNDNEKILESSSGGIFAYIAEKIIAKNGVAVGCSMEYKDGGFIPMHIVVDNEEELSKLYMSKYVQSDIGYVFRKVKKFLDSGRLVLFSGTPCQVSGLKGFLKKDYDNILTIDIVCHGVPSSKMFKDYIREYERKYKCEIKKFKFRSKEKGWKVIGQIGYIDKFGKYKERTINPDKSSYYSLFLKSHIYRNSCYSCKYASKNRPSDITIGDYWGIEEKHPQSLKENGGVLDKNKGISCVIIYTEKGKKVFYNYLNGLNIYKSSFEDIAEYNTQLIKPAESKKRRMILNVYKIFGYRAIESIFDCYLTFQSICIKIKSIIKKLISYKN